MCTRPSPPQEGLGTRLTLSLNNSVELVAIERERSTIALSRGWSNWMSRIRDNRVCAMRMRMSRIRDNRPVNDKKG